MSYRVTGSWTWMYRRIGKRNKEQRNKVNGAWCTHGTYKRATNIFHLSRSTPIEYESLRLSYTCPILKSRVSIVCYEWQCQCEVSKLKMCGKNLVLFLSAIICPINKDISKIFLSFSNVTTSVWNNLMNTFLFFYYFNFYFREREIESSWSSTALLKYSPHRKNSFAEEFKNLTRHRSENIFVYIKLYRSLSVDDNAVKSFNVLATSLSVLHNYFDGPNKIIFRFISAKPFFPCSVIKCRIIKQYLRFFLIMLYII